MLSQEESNTTTLEGKVEKKEQASEEVLEEQWEVALEEVKWGMDSEEDSEATEWELKKFNELALSTITAIMTVFDMSINYI